MSASPLPVPASHLALKPESLVQGFGLVIEVVIPALTEPTRASEAARDIAVAAASTATAKADQTTADRAAVAADRVVIVAARDAAQDAAEAASDQADIAFSKAGEAAASAAASQMARVGAETAQGSAQTARTGAETARDIATAAATSAAQVAPNRTYPELIADTSPAVGTVRQVSTGPNSGTYELKLVGGTKTWVRTGDTVPGLDARTTLVEVREAAVENRVTRLSCLVWLPFATTKGRYTVGNDGLFIEAPGADIADLKKRPTPSALVRVWLPWGAADQVVRVGPNGSIIQRIGGTAPAPLVASVRNATTKAAVPIEFTVDAGDTICGWIVGPQAQSLGEGSFTAPTLTDQTYMSTALSLSGAKYTDRIFMPDVGIQPKGRSWSSMIGAYEQPYQTIVETGWLRFAMRVADLVYADTGKEILQFIVCNAKSGTPVEDLSRGSDPFEQAMADLKTAVTAAAKLGKKFCVYGSHVNQQHANVYDMGKTAWKRLTLNLALDTRRRIQDITGQSHRTMFFVHQGGFAHTDFLKEEPIRQAQLELCIEHPDIFVMLGPDIMVDKVDGTHCDTPNCIIDRETKAAGAADHLTGRAVTPFRIETIAVTGAAELTLGISCPKLPLVIDTTGAVVATSNIAGFAGLEIDDRNGAAGAPTITALEVLPDPVVGGATRVMQGQAYVKATLSGPLSSGLTRRLGAGLHQIGNGQSRTNGGRTLFRSSRSSARGGALAFSSVDRAGVAYPNGTPVPIDDWMCPSYHRTF